MIGYKDREITLGGRSQAYFNLHKKTFSMKQKNLVVLHSDVITLNNVSFKVNETGRQKVIQEQRKNVHAYVVGDFTVGCSNNVQALEKGYREAYYNPYKVNSFVDKETGEAVREAESVILQNKRIFYK